MVEPAKFVNEYVTWLKSHLALNSGAGLTDDVATEIASALVGKRKQREAYVPETEWDRFVRDSKLDVIQHVNEPLKSTKGVKPLESWELILVEVAAELLAEQIKGSSDIIYSNIAEIALERAKKVVGDKRVPKVETITKKVKEILKKRDGLLESAGS